MTSTIHQLAAALALSALAGAAQSAAVFALTRDSGTLVRFDSAAPGNVTAVGPISGATTRLDGIDFRPADGGLYGYNAATSGIYRVDPATGATTLVSTASAGTANARVGIDFNPAADRLRVVSDNDDNLRINVATGATLVDGKLTYRAGDVNAGADPSIVEAAYTNNDNNPATGTQLFYIDDRLDVLVTTTSPNAGELITIGALGLDVDEFLGFDILTPPAGGNFAFASLRSGGSQGFYAIDLGTGAASLLGGIGLDGLRGLAVAAVPEPGSLALALGGLAGLGLGGFRRRRRSTSPAAR